jgi:cytochrome c
MKSWSSLVAAAAVLALSGSAFAATPAEYITANKCSKCHTATTTKKGPSFASLAEKYKADASAKTKILNTLKTGGKEDHDKVPGSDAELQAVIDYILAGAK